MIDPPLVSIWLPTRNRAALLRRAVESVIAQTYPHIQLLVVDDASDDETPELLRDMAKRFTNDRSLVVVRNAGSRGASAARNLALARAEGEFVTGLDDDDAFKPTRIEQLLKAYHDGVAGVCTCLVEQGKDYQLPAWQPPQLIDRNRIRRKNFVGNQVFTRTGRLRELGGFDEEMPGWEDYELWLRLVDRYGPVLKLAECTYVLNRDDAVSRISSSDRVLAGYQAFMARHANSMTESQQRHQEINYLHDRCVAIGLSELMRLWSRDTAVRLSALVLKVRAPWLYRLVVRATVQFARWRHGAGRPLGQQ